MPHPDGTPTADDHVRAAHTSMDTAAAWAANSPGGTAAVTMAIDALTHAVLALVELTDQRRREGSAW